MHRDPHAPQLPALSDASHLGDHHSVLVQAAERRVRAAAPVRATMDGPCRTEPITSVEATAWTASARSNGGRRLPSSLAGASSSSRVETPPWARNRKRSSRGVEPGIPLAPVLAAAARHGASRSGMVIWAWPTAWCQRPGRRRRAVGDRWAVDQCARRVGRLEARSTTPHSQIAAPLHDRSLRSRGNEAGLVVAVDPSRYFNELGLRASTAPVRTAATLGPRSA
jgi:hypothetical protein